MISVCIIRKQVVSLQRQTMKLLILNITTMAKSIKGTRTEKHLMMSFAGESQARMRYT